MPRRVGALLALTLLTCSAAACAGTDAPGGTAGPAGTGRSDPPAGPVTIAFVGDMHAERGIRRALQDDPSTLLAGVRPAFDRADLVVGNLETAITEGGTRADKAYAFRAPATFLTALHDGGVDVVNISNNHGMDFGLNGLEDTLAARDAGPLDIIGIGADEDEAFRPYTTTINGQRIAVIGATQVLDSSIMQAWTAGPDKPGLASAKEVDRLTRAVREAKQDHDVVVAFLHWGTERQDCPNQAQLDLVPQLKEAGAQVIVGSHAHVLLGGGYDGDTYVHYGLGNFLFYSGGRGNAQVETGVQLLTIEDGRVVDDEWLPGRIQNNDLPTLLEGDAAQTAQRQWQGLRECTGLSATPS